MAVIDSTNFIDTSTWVSQTPRNLVKDNYYLNELQQKVDADWEYRPNKVLIERETGTGSEVYAPIEVVLQTVKNDKGEAVSADWKRVVFRDIKEKTYLGDRFIFSEDFNVDADKEDKNVWLCVNHEPYSFTASEVICRCEGTLGSIYVNDGGQTEYHYEPVVKPMALSGAGIQFNEVAVDNKGSLVYIAQKNKYTEQYFVNQRFIVGAVTKRKEFINGTIQEKTVADVYKVTNIHEYEASYTYKESQVPLVKIYLSIDQMSEQDDIENRIAFNGLVPEPLPETKSGTKTIKFVQPEVLPQSLTSDIVFEPKIYEDGVATSETIAADAVTLGGSVYASKASVGAFVTFTDNGDGTWTLHKLKSEPTFTVCGSFHGTGDLATLKIDFALRLV